MSNAGLLLSGHPLAGPCCHLNSAMSWVVNSCFSEAPVHLSLTTSRPGYSPIYPGTKVLHPGAFSLIDYSLCLIGG